MAGSINKSFSLHTHHDRELIARLDALGRGELSKVVRDALNEYFSMRQGVTLAQVYQEVQSVKQLLESGGTVNGAQSDHVNDDDDDGDTLDADILGAFD